MKMSKKNYIKKLDEIEKKKSQKNIKVQVDFSTRLAK